MSALIDVHEQVRSAENTRGGPNSNTAQHCPLFHWLHLSRSELQFASEEAFVSWRVISWQRGLEWLRLEYYERNVHGKLGARRRAGTRSLIVQG